MRLHYFFYPFFAKKVIFFRFFWSYQKKAISLRRKMDSFFRTPLITPEIIT